MTETESQNTNDTVSKAPRKKRPWWRRLLKWFLVLLLVILLLPVGLLVGWQVSFVRKPLVQFGLGFAGVALDGKVALADLRGDLLTHVILEKFSWKDRRGKEMVSVERIEAHYDLMGFLSTGELLVTKVLVRRPIAAMGPKVYGLNPKPGGGVLIEEIDGSTPEKRVAARKKYAQVAEIIDLLSHITPTLPTFCKNDTICGPKATCASFKHSPPPKYSEWRGVCKDKPKPKVVSKGGFKMRIPSITLENVDFDWVIAPKAKPLSFRKFYAKAIFGLGVDGFDVMGKVREARVVMSNPDINVRDLRVDFTMKGDDMRAKNLILRFGKRSEILLDAHLSLAKILGVNAKLKKIFVAPEDMKPIVPAWPVKPDIALRGEVTGSLAAIKAKIRGTIGKTVLKLDAKSGVLSQTYDVDLGLLHVNLAELLGNPAMKSKISLKLTAKGKGFSDATNGKVALDVTPGYFQKYGYKHVKLRAALKDRQVQIKQFKVATPFAKVDVKGRAHLLTGKFLVNVGVKVGNLRKIGALVKQKLRGALQVKAKLYGDKWMPIKPSWARITIQRFWHPSASLRSAVIKADVFGLQPKIKARLTIDAKGIKAAGRRIKYLMLTMGYEMDGALQKVALSRLRFNIGSGQYRLQKRGWVKRRRQNLATRLSFDTKTLVARVSRLWLRRRSERIRVDGWIDVKRWRQDLNVEIKRLDLAAIRRALGIMPKSKLAGLVDVKVAFAGSFYRPRLSLGFKLRGGRFQEYKQLSTDVNLAYATRKLRNKQRLTLDADVSMGTIKLVTLRSSLPIGIALRGRLRPPLLLANPAVRVDLNAPILFDLKVPDLVLDRLQKIIGQPVKGRINLRVQLKKNLRDPRFQFYFNADKVNWRRYRKVRKRVSALKNGKRASVVKLKFGKTKVKTRIRNRVRYTTKRVIDMQISNASANFQIEYEKGRLFFEPKANWVRHKGLSMLTLAGNIPLALTLFRQRRRRRNQSSLGVSYRLMPKKPIDFKVTFPERKLKDFRPFLPASLLKSVGHIKGRFGGHVQLKGLPFHPQLDLQLRLKKASLCPLENGKFRCSKASFSLGGSKKRKKTRSLRIHGVDFGLDVIYKPPPKRSIKISSRRITFSAPGNLMVASQLKVKDTTLFEISKSVTVGGKSVPTGVAMAFAVHPQTLKPFFRLFVDKPTRFELNIPKTNISSGDTFCVTRKKRRGKRKPSIIDFVRLPILRRLRGQISLKVALRKKLSEPMAKVDFRFRNGGYLFGCDGAGHPLWLDGVLASAQAAINKGFATVSVNADVLKRPLLRISANLMAKAGLEATRHPKTRQPVYKPKFVLGKKVFARLLICRFELSKLGKLGGIFKKLAGTIQGQLQLKGDPACPVLFSTPQASAGKPSPDKPCEGIERTSHIELTNLILGDQPKRSRKKTFRKRKIKRLHITKLRLDLASIAKGRTRIKVESNQLKCVRAKFALDHSSKKAKLDQLLARSRKFCAGMKISAPVTSKKTGVTTHWFYKVGEYRMFNVEVKGPLPLRFLSLPPRQAAKRCKHWGGPSPSQALKLLFSSQGINLDFIETFVPGLDFKAYLNGQVKIEGDGKSPPKIDSSQITLTFNKIKYPAFGVEIGGSKRRGRKTVAAKSRIRVSFGQEFLKVRGQLQGNEGSPLTIRGKIRHKSFVPQDYNIRVKATDFRPMDTQKYRLTLQTDIKIWKKPETGVGSQPIWVRGKITIPRFLFTLPEGSTSPSTYKEDPDIAVLGEASEKKLRLRLGAKAERPPSSGGGMNIDLRIVIPGNFVVRNRDLQIEARTNRDNPLRVKMIDGSIQLAGGIQIVRGEISQYGKRFSVKTGSGVSFTGQTIPLSDIGAQINPRIDVIAVHEFKPPKGSSLDRRGHKKVNIQIVAIGPLQGLKPDLKVVDAFSDAGINLDKVNILSLLLTGTTTDDLSAGQQKNIASQAFGMVGSALASELRNQLSGVLKVDVLNINTGTSIQDVKVEFGWYLTSDIFFQVAAKPSPLDEENYWEALFDYSISRQWSLELRFGQIKRNLSQPIRASGQVFYRLRY